MLKLISIVQDVLGGQVNILLTLFDTCVSG